MEFSSCIITLRKHNHKTESVVVIKLPYKTLQSNQSFGDQRFIYLFTVQKHLQNMNIVVQMYLT